MVLTVYCKLNNKYKAIIAIGNVNGNKLTNLGICKLVTPIKFKSIKYIGKENITVAIIDCDFLNDRKYYYNSNRYGNKSDLIYVKLSDGNSVVKHQPLLSKQFNEINEYYELSS